jgi:hypothetical protein
MYKCLVQLSCHTSTPLDTAGNGVLFSVHVSLTNAIFSFCALLLISCGCIVCLANAAIFPAILLLDADPGFLQNYEKVFISEK